MQHLTKLVRQAQAGDLEAFGRLVAATQTMAYAVARSVLRDGRAEDAAQEAYPRAFRRLRTLDEPAGFVTWLRRIVVTVALNMRRANRVTLVQIDDAPDVPILDEEETRWSEAQRLRLSAALLAQPMLADIPENPVGSVLEMLRGVYQGFADVEPPEIVDFADARAEIVTHMGGDPARHTAMGVGYGLERVAMLRYGIDDIRKIERARVA